MTQIFTAKTVEEAKALAARTFGASVSDITFEVLEEPKKGFLGFKKGEAKVRATYVSIDVNADDHRTEQNFTPPSLKDVVFPEEPAQKEEAPVEEAAPVEEPPAEESTPAVEEAPAWNMEMADEEPDDIIVEETPVEETVEAVEEAPVEETVEAAEEAPAEEVVETVEETPAEEVVETVEETPVEETVEAVEGAPVEETVEAAEEAPVEEAVEAVEEAPTVTETTVETVPQDEELVSGEPSEAALAKIEAAKAYLSSVFQCMGVEAEFEVTAGAESAIINIVTPNSGTIIGRRGDTLDSLQYLTFLVANRGDKEFYRIILNSADYRERRRKTLEELAAKIAKSVLRSGKTQSLEPMNPYERRIVHSAISAIEGVSSRSVGEEPYRKVVISSTNAKPNNRRRKPRNDKNDSGRGKSDRNRRDRRKNPDSPPERISMDSMKTSFEKDYKRPKAEDEINAGLYGKIEF